tara:strand:- start:958 stop:1755 length:798 start_codon:yes stop_codon:yes gene_type:complete
MKKLLILYPHGLGDCILLTPTLRNYFFNTGNKASVAILERFKSAKIFDNNPYVDNIIYTKDAWNDFDSPEEGFNIVKKQCEEWGKQNGYEKIVMPQHNDWRYSKILINFSYCDIKPTSVFTEIFTSDEDRKTAKNFIKQKVSNKPFGFVQTVTGRPLANLPKGYGKLWLKKYKGLQNIIEAGIDFDISQFNINTQIEIMRLSSAVCLPDSVFSNACGAIGKPIDHLYFSPTWGIKGYKRVEPLHSVRQNVVYELDKSIIRELEKI